MPLIKRRYIPYSIVGVPMSLNVYSDRRVPDAADAKTSASAPKGDNFEV